MQLLGHRRADKAWVQQLLLFEDASLESIESILEQAAVFAAAPGEVILAPNVPNDTVYVVLKGTVRVDVVDREGREHSHAGRGECLGELSVIDGGATTALVVAVDACELLALPGETVLRLVERSHAVARNLVRLLSRRLKGSNRLLRSEAEQSELLRHQVSFDALTGLHSRAWLEHTLPRMCSRVRHGGPGFAIALCDVDHFKRVNDSCGHLAGDRVLQKVAGVLSATLRPTDFAARFGGEELLAILCEVEAIEGALAAAERIRNAVQTLRVEALALPPLSVSIGVARCSGEQSAEDLLRRADHALYRAKNAGRNRVEAAP